MLRLSITSLKKEKKKTRGQKATCPVILSLSRKPWHEGGLYWDRKRPPRVQEKGPQEQTYRSTALSTSGKGGFTEQGGEDGRPNQ